MGEKCLTYYDVEWKIKEHPTPLVEEGKKRKKSYYVLDASSQ